MKKERILAVICALSLTLCGCAKEDNDAFGGTKATDDKTAAKVEGGEEIAGEAAYDRSADIAKAATPSQNQQVNKQPEPTAGLLTAGEWNDNKNFSFITNLVKTNAEFKAALKQWGVDPTERYCVRVANGNSAPVAGAQVSLLDAGGNRLFSAVTDNTGTAYLFRNLTTQQDGEAKSISVKRGDIGATAEITQGTTDYSITLEAASPEKSLDLMLVFDTTGSMGDELTYIQKEFENILQTVRSQNGNIPLRTSLSFYRDKGDEYVVRPYDFTDDFSAVLGALSEQKAAGGGDTPEAVHSALDDAVNNHSWSEDSVKLMLLVLDAPPHGDADVTASVRKSMLDAAAKGIRIIPVIASGSDSNNEALMRSLAMATNGTYAFLTNDSGIGGDHAEPTVGAYSVEKLNELIIRIIGSYLS